MAKAEALVWEDPPRRTKYDWVKIAESLRSNPMEWAKVFDEDRSSIVVAVRQGSILTMHPDLGFETRTANNNVKAKPRTCTLYVRYNPARVKNGLTEAIIRSRRSK